MKRNTYRDGRVHVCRRMCKTCIFRPETEMEFARDRMVEDATKNQTAIICHATLDGDNAVCRGFFDKHKTQPLQVAERLGVLEFVEPSKEQDHDE